MAEDTGLSVLPHSVKKPGCGDEIMAYFKKYPETGVTDPSHVAVVGDRLTTDMMLANMMGGWGIWVKDGVVPLQKKSIVSTMGPANIRNSGIRCFLFSANQMISSPRLRDDFCHSCWLGDTHRPSLAARLSSSIGWMLLSLEPFTGRIG